MFDQDPKYCIVDAKTMAGISPQERIDKEAAAKAEQQKINLDVFLRRGNDLVSEPWLYKEKTREFSYACRTSDEQVASKACAIFQSKGWNCKITFINDFGGAYGLSFYNPRLKPSFWWRIW